jgi:hypothetical protein
MADQRSVTEHLAQVLLGVSLETFVVSRRAQTPPRAWRRVSRDLYDATAGRIDLTGEALRRWYGDLDPTGERAQAAAS